MMSEAKTPSGEEKTYTQADLDAAIAKAVESETGGLKSKVQELLDESKAAKTKAKEAEEAKQAAADEAAAKSGDVEALTASWQKKWDAREVEWQAREAELTGSLTQMTSGATATDIANRLAVDADHAENIADYLKARLRTEFEGGTPRTVVLGQDGKPSALTVEELESEVAEMPRFSRLVAGTKAAGGGAAHANGGAAPKKFSDMTGSELVALRRKNPQEYDRLKQAG